MPSFVILNPPDPGDLTTFKSVLDRYGNLALSCRFMVRLSMPKNIVGKYTSFPFQGVIKDLTFLCEQAELPGKSVTVNDGRYYGPNFKFTTQTEYTDTILNFIVRDQMYEKEFFDNWMQAINPTDNYNFNYKKDYVSQIEIFQYSVFQGAAGSVFEDKLQAMYAVTLRDAFPTTVAPMGLVWGEEGFHRISVTFAYTEWTKINDPKRTGYSLVTTSSGPKPTIGGSSTLFGESNIPPGSGSTIGR